MKQRFLFSIILAAAVFFLVIWISGGHPFGYFDAPTFIIVGIVPLLYQLILFGPQNFKNAFSSPLKKECSSAEAFRALTFFKMYNKSVWIFALAAVGISLFAVFAYLDDPQALGPNLAVTILSGIYASIISLFLILPYTAIAKQRLSEIGLEM
jgi:flagellar motor component MotA